MSNTRRAQKVKPTAVAESLADHLLTISVDKWESGPPPAELRLKRYRGHQPFNADGDSLFDDSRWATDDADLKELNKEIAFWLEPDGESRGDACIAFMREVAGFTPRRYQEEVVKRLFRNRRHCVRSPRGAGKSAIAANIVIYFVTVHAPCKVPTTAGSWGQLEEFLWPEIRLWVGRADWSLVGIKPKTNLLDMSFGAEDGDVTQSTQKAFAIASDKPELIEGAHSEHVLILFDEAKAIPPSTFDATEGTLSHAGAYALIISTPGTITGRFYEIQSRAKGTLDWDVQHITFKDQVDALDGEKKAAKIKWAADRKEQWGEDSPMYRNHVLGEFADTGEDSVIPLEHVEIAMARWRRWKEAGFPEDEEWVGVEPKRAMGADIAGQGKDRTCVARRIGVGIRELEFRHKATTMQTANRLMADTTNYPLVKIESDGIGAGVYDRCVEIKANDETDLYRGVIVLSVVAGSKTMQRDKSGELGFWNKRSALWWRMRELLDPDNGHGVMLPDDSSLKSDLTTPKWELREGSGEFKGRIKVESKDDIRKRLPGGRSTDAADAVIIALDDESTVAFTETVRVKATSASVPGATFYDVQNPRKWPGWGPRGIR